MLRRRMLVAITCAVAAGVLSACAAPGYNVPRLQSELEHAGATAAQAQCVTDRLSGTFDENQLGSHSVPTDAELATTRDILSQCKVTLPLNPPPS